MSLIFAIGFTGAVAAAIYCASVDNITWFVINVVVAVVALVMTVAAIGDSS